VDEATPSIPLLNYESFSTCQDQSSLVAQLNVLFAVEPNLVAVELNLAAVEPNLAADAPAPIALHPWESSSPTSYQRNH